MAWSHDENNLGHPISDFSSWTRAEKHVHSRQIYTIKDGYGASDLAGELAAVVAASVAALYKNGKITIADSLKKLEIAKKFLNFAIDNPGIYHESIRDTYNIKIADTVSNSCQSGIFS